MAIFFVVNTHTRSMHTWIWCLCFSRPGCRLDKRNKSRWNIHWPKKKTPARWTFSFFFFQDIVWNWRRRKILGKIPYVPYLLCVCIEIHRRVGSMESSSAAAREAGQQQPARPASLYILLFNSGFFLERGGSCANWGAAAAIYAVGANNISSRRLDPSFFRNVQAGCWNSKSSV